MPTTATEPPAEAVNQSAILLTKKQVASLLQCSTRYVERSVTEGRLKALKPTGKMFRVRQSDLEKFLDPCSTIERAV